MPKCILLTLVLLLTGCFENGQDKQPLTPRLESAQTKVMALCAGCHGPKGIGTTSLNPNLACQKKEYMVRQLEFYRDGTRATHLPMANIAKMLTEDEVDAVSEWYSITGCTTK